MAISKAGKRAERLFFEQTGASQTTNRADGDAIFDGEFVEIKGKSKGDTINQVRAVKYIVLVIYHERKRKWYVVPAHEIVRMVAQRKRGQHTENPFESATLSIKKLERFKIKAKKNLKKCIRKARIEASKYPKLKDAMNRVRARAKELANEAKSEVQELLASK